MPDKARALRRSRERVVRPRPNYPPNYLEAALVAALVRASWPEAREGGFVQHEPWAVAGSRARRMECRNALGIAGRVSNWLLLSPRVLRIFVSPGLAVFCSSCSSVEKSRSHLCKANLFLSEPKSCQAAGPGTWQDDLRPVTRRRQKRAADGIADRKSTRLNSSHWE